MTGSVTFFNPEELHPNPAFSQVVVVEGGAKTVYIGGQNAVNTAGEIVGRGDMAAQAEQVFRNLEFPCGPGAHGWSTS